MNKPATLFAIFVFTLFLLATDSCRQQPELSPAQTASPTIVVLSVKGIIDPVLVDYIDRGIKQAEKEHAVACVFQLDTPGGLDTARCDIIQLMDNAQVPIVVYVPAGARAASAGFFITMAADIAAMAPDSTIGAAHPVTVGTEGEAQMSEAMKGKVVNDAVAYAQGIAKAHGRNVEWAEKAVRESAAVLAREALELRVIEIVATNLENLISQLDGRQVATPDGRVVTLNTRGATIVHVLEK